MVAGLVGGDFLKPPEIVIDPPDLVEGVELHFGMPDLTAVALGVGPAESRGEPNVKSGLPSREPRFVHSRVPGLRASACPKLFEIEHLTSLRLGSPSGQKVGLQS